ncbi:hypothetical protein [Bacillus thuringiensis]|uniref:hypothetical protein n=1 Tax=Bacillus thuringiensis TaxID=1428 RepID=UPI002DBB60F2|nr:hypothetical protein [Bacillus thuringiensis]MEC3553397.1 hypothetical protein [Bacillus thuringiensis]
MFFVFFQGFSINKVIADIEIKMINTKIVIFVELGFLGVLLKYLIGVPPAFRKKTTLRKSELKNQKIYHYSKTHTVSFFIQKIIQHNINCVVLGVIININLGV